MNIYNDTPFVLIIESTIYSYESSPSVNRIIQVRTDGVNQKIDICAKDAVGTVIKTATFYSKRDHSWIVNDDCIRRQKHGSDFFIADEMAKYNEDYSPTDEMWLESECDTIKCHPWNNKTFEKNNLTIDQINEERIENSSLSSNGISNHQLTHQLNIGIYNATPFCLQINLYDKMNNLICSSSNNPQIDRISTVTSDVDYPFLSIYAMDAYGSTLKNAMFYSYKEWSWIVGDECIRRRQKSASFYVADSCTSSQSEEYYSSGIDYLWRNCNDITRYQWKDRDYCPEPRCHGLDLCSNTNLIPILRKERTVEIDVLRISLKGNSSGFKVHDSNERKNTIDFINNEITASIIEMRSTPRSNITNNMSNNREYLGLRLDLQGQDSDGQFNRFSIQLGNRTFATVHVQISLRICDKDVEVIREAFRQSLANESGVWITGNGNSRHDDDKYTYSWIPFGEFMIWIRKIRN